MARWVVAAASILILAGCGTDGGGGSDFGGSGGGTDGGSGGTGGAGGTGGEGGTGGVGGTGGSGGTGIAWETCYLEGAGRAECATLSMPLDRDDPTSGTIPFFVRRILADGESRGQLWLLEGGPGVNGGQLGLYASAFLLDLGLDVYMPDYRGVGRSAALDCETGTTTQCMAHLEDTYGEDLVRFSSSDAVRDVGEAIGLFRKPGDQVFVWGTSYGTVTAHRFLHLFPDTADGVVLDSSCGAAGCDLVHADVDTDRNAHDVADLCAADEFCAGKLGAEPWAKVADVLERVEAGHCSEAVSRSLKPYVRPIFTTLMGPYFLPSVGMALLHRLDRCDPADVPAVQNLLGIFLGDGGTGWIIQDGVAQSELLYYNIVFNEFWDPSYTQSYVEELERGLVATDGAVLYFPPFYEQWSWPEYDVPADLKRWAEAEVPVLVLNGTLDAQTRHERMIDAAEVFTGPHQHVVLVPYANHGTFLSSLDPTTPTCGATITRQFLFEPTAELDLSCLDQQRPPRFDTAPYPSYWFGTPDLWENVATARPARVELADPFLRARLAEVRARLRNAAR